MDNRNAQKLKSIRAAIGILLAAGTILATHPSSSSAQACPGNIDPYTASSVVLAECHVGSFPIASRSRLPDGGKATAYATGRSQMTVLTPPAGFDPSKASASELARYGIPAEPPASEPATRAAWEKMAHNFHPVPAPSTLHNAIGARFDMLGYNEQHIWSGYYDDILANGKAQMDALHYAWATWIEPTGYASSCSGNAVAVWTGLGGVNSGAFGQAGTTIGNWGLGLRPNEAWAEINESANETWDGPIYATTGQPFSVNVSHASSNPKEYIFEYYNAHTGQSWSVAGFSSTYDGSTADFIVERPAGGPLENFRTIEFTNVSAAVQHYPVNHYSYAEARMWNASSSSLLATNSPLSSNGHAFSVTQDHCR